MTNLTPLELQSEMQRMHQEVVELQEEFVPRINHLVRSLNKLLNGEKIDPPRNYKPSDVRGWLKDNPVTKQPE